MQDKIESLVDYIQRNCLWQFFSRSWDREENISGVLSKTEELLCGKQPEAATDIDRCHLADAKLLSAEFKSGFPWIKGTSAEDLHTLMQGVKDRMSVIAVEKSRNAELHVKYY